MILKYIYLAIIALLLVFIVANMFRKDKLLYQIDAALVLIPLVLRLLGDLRPAWVQELKQYLTGAD